MRHLCPSVVVCLISALFAYAQVSGSCTTTRTITSTTTIPDVTYRTKVVSETDTYFWSTLYLSKTVTSTLITTSYVERSTTIYIVQTKSTRTLGAYKLKTKSCPPGPSYVLACPKIKATETNVQFTYTIKGLVTSTWTSTDYFQVQLNTTTLTSTTTAGKPPTTKTVTKTSTRATTTTTSTVIVTSYKKIATTTYTNSPVVNTTTVTKSLASPTATATLDLFSLQITNTSNPIDGYTWGQQDRDVVVQNASVWRYYIDPSTQYLIHAPSGNYLAYIICDGEECYYPFTFVPDKPVPANDGNTATHPLKCSIECGDILSCWDADDSDGRSYVEIVVFDNYLGAQIGYTPWGDGGPAIPVKFRAVGPTRGR